MAEKGNIGHFVNLKMCTPCIIRLRLQLSANFFTNILYYASVGLVDHIVAPRNTRTEVSLENIAIFRVRFAFIQTGNSNRCIVYSNNMLNGYATDYIGLRWSQNCGSRNGVFYYDRNDLIFYPDTARSLLAHCAI